METRAGSGFDLAELFPKSRFVGMDFSRDAIAAAQHEASTRGLRNIEFVATDLSDFHQRAEPESFDVITTFDAVHDQAAPLNVLRGIHRALTRDGVYLMQDIKGSTHVYNNVTHPIGTFLYTVSCMHCMACGATLCCDSWPNRHATTHARASHHPVLACCFVAPPLVIVERGQ